MTLTDKQRYERYLLKLTEFENNLTEQEKTELNNFYKLSQSMNLYEYSDEIWISIEKTCGYYSVSNYCRIKRNNKSILSKFGNVIEWREGIIRQRKHKGYMVAGISVNNKKYSLRVHTEFAIAFIPNVNNLPIPNHKNGIRHDNRKSNIEWDTIANNLSHSYRELGKVASKAMLGKKGKLCPTSRSILQLSMNGDVLKEWGSISEAARAVKIDQSCIGFACKKGTKSAGFLWKYNSEAKYKVGNRNYSYKKQVLQFDLNGNFIKEWSSAMAAAKHIGCESTHIARASRGKSKTSFGFVWAYKNAV